jgi:hypothetical protein
VGRVEILGVGQEKEKPAIFCPEKIAFWVPIRDSQFTDIRNTIHKSRVSLVKNKERKEKKWRALNMNANLQHSFWSLHHFGRYVIVVAVHLRYRV